MRRMLFLLLVLVSSMSLFAADRGTLRVSAFVVNGNQAVEWADSGDAYAASADYRWSSHLSSAVTVSDEPVKVTRFRLDTIDGTLGSFPYTKSIHLHPLDAVLRYHFAAGSRLDPYVGGGGRYVSAEGTKNFRSEAEGGLTFTLTRHLGVEASYKRLYNQHYGQSLRAGPGGVLPQDMSYVEGRRSRAFLGLNWTL